MKDTLKLRSASEPFISLELQLVARVLGKKFAFITFIFQSKQFLKTGKGQGTPMLKDGIHIIAVDLDEESEASDWQGFE